jgi:uncharacterized membrane protein (UPF0127 family)
MSLTRVIIFFGIILFIFAAFISYQFDVRGISAQNGQPQLPTGTVTIDGHKFTVEIAKTAPQQQMGLSDRKSLPASGGMLFIFPGPQYLSFWMKQMKFPLDMVFIYKGKIAYIARNVPVPPVSDESPPIIQPTISADSVLEINAGLSKKYNFKNGDTVASSL